MMSFFFSIHRWMKIIFILLVVNNLAIPLTGAYEIAHVIKQMYNEHDCSRPQSRIAYIEDEYPDYNSAAVYLPHGAIVQRCDNSIGCCEKGHRYVPTQEEKMAFDFQEFLNGNKSKKEVMLTSHLHCECHSIWQHK